MTTANALDRFLDPLVDVLTPDVAAKLVALRADDKLQARLDELAEKSNEGQLTEQEGREYDAYLQGITVVSVIQAKARAALRHRAAP